jgi:peptide/nickel transport system substrate-binding protein
VRCWTGMSFARCAAASLLLAIPMVAACGGGGAASSPQSHDKPLIVEQDFTGFDSLDPARGAFPTAVLVDKSVYSTLLAVNPHDLTKPYPSLATSFDISADGKTFTFHLRHGVQFASGNPFTAADVVFSLNRTKNINSFGAVVMTGLTVSSPDDSTVVLQSDSANLAVPVIMTQSNAGIMDSKLMMTNGGTADAHDNGDAYLNSANNAGAGPYTIQSVDRSSEIVLKANPHYWGAKPAFATVDIRNTPAATQRLDIQDGQAQLALGISPRDAASLTGANVIASPSADLLLLSMNADPSVSMLTANSNFRQAIKDGVDYKGLVALAGKGAIEATGFVPVGVLGSLPESTSAQRNLSQAKSALAQAGVSNPTIELDYTTDQNLDGLPVAPFAEKIQSDLKDVGITVNLVASPIAVLLPKIQAGKVQMWLVPNPADYPDPADFLPLVPGGYWAGWFGWTTGQNPSVDALVTNAVSATSVGARGTAYQALAKASNQENHLLYMVQGGRTIVAAQSISATLNPFDYVDLGTVS